MSDDLSQRYADAVSGVIDEWATMPGDSGQFIGRLVAAVMAVRDEELEQLRYERRLLGAARMVLDLVAAGDSPRWGQARREAGDLAQRIVDEIGHPVTDEPALGPEWRERAETAEAAIARVRQLRDVFEVNARTIDGVAGRNFFELFVEELDAALDYQGSPTVAETPAQEEER